MGGWYPNAQYATPAFTLERYLIINLTTLKTTEQSSPSDNIIANRWNNEAEFTLDNFYTYLKWK